MKKEKKNIRKVPNLRFPEFKGEWKQEKLKNISEINPKHEGIPKSFIYIDLESVINGRLLKEVKIFRDNAPSRAQRLLKKEDVIFQMVRPYQKNNLLFNKEGDYVASTGYAQIRTKENSRFVYQFLHNQDFVRKVLNKCTGTSYPAINSKDLGEIKVPFPELKEQLKISTFFSLNDKKIQAQIKTIEHLETLIKGVSKKLFSQELRFTGFDDNWEVRKLKELCQVTKGKQLNREKLTKKGKYPCQNGGILPSGYTDKFNSEADSITISEGGNSCGYVNFIKTKFWLGGHCYKVTPLVNINKVYLYFLLKHNENLIMRLRVGSGLPNIQIKSIKKYKICISKSLEEQTKIASFLSSIDEKIETEKAILEQLKNQKKYFLQNLFV